MATGFASVQRNAVNKNPGYKTLFERVSNKTGGEKKSLSWYRAAVKNEAAAYKKNFNKYILNERSDRVGAVEEQDANELRRYTVQGHMYMFEYKAKMKYLPYYDQLPLVYVIKTIGKSEFWGANLHYLSPKKRIIATKKLMQGRIDIPKKYTPLRREMQHQTPHQASLLGHHDLTHHDPLQSRCVVAACY